MSQPFFYFLSSSMKANGEADREHSNRPTTKPTTASPPTRSSVPRTTILNNPQHSHIHDNTFVTKVAADPSLEVLYNRVAPNAILNAGGRADEVRCHPGTREEVIGRIEKWGDTQDGLTAPIFWLSGPAGAGKTAIVQTIAERCNQSGVPHANFFFFRTDTSRNNASPLVATLLHQIILLYPSLRDPVSTILSANPLIFHSVLEHQLTELIVGPLRIIQQSSSDYRPLIVLVDGLDECDSASKRSQKQLLHVFDTVLAEQPCPFCLLVASRDESQIRAAFNRTSSQSLQLYLDDNYSPEKDIQLFVEAQFEQVRKTHPLAHTLGAMWPSVKNVNYIVEKSSGQFIYAATVMHFISDSAASPMVSLERVQGAAQLATKTPFSHLDAIYSHILSQADDQEALKDILHAQLLITRSNTPIPLMKLLQLFNQRYTEAMVLSCLADLTPIGCYLPKAFRLQFHHASFSDYLWDHSRSGGYSLDAAAFNYKTLPAVWTHMEYEANSPFWQSYSLDALCLLKKLPPGLMEMLAPSQIWSLSCVPPSQFSVFQTLSNLCICDDDINNLKCIMRYWIHYFCRSNPQGFDDIKHLPYSRRYWQLARSGFRWKNAPDDKMFTALCPETDSDRDELTLWIDQLLHHIHKQWYHSNAKQCKRLLKAWISWAVRNDIPCDGLEDIPEAQKYIERNMKEKRATYN